MASQYYAIERGAKPGTVTTGSSTQTKTVEVAINLADGATHAEVVDMIEQLGEAISRGPWPPA